MTPSTSSLLSLSDQLQVVVGSRLVTRLQKLRNTEAQQDTRTLLKQRVFYKYGVFLLNMLLVKCGFVKVVY